MKRQLTQSKVKEDLKSKLERQKKRLDKLGKKERDYKKLITQMGDFKDMSPDEIKVKLDQIYDWNEKK
jgi:chaperonin cofactor prefoldin